MKTVSIYCRVSTVKQKVDSQLHTLREYCKARGLTVHKEYVDEGVSGAKESRPALDRLMDDVRKKKVEAVLVYRFNRFARTTKHQILALEEFRSLGVDFISYQENIDTSSPIGKAIFTVIAAFGELQRDMIIENVKAGLAKAKAKGVVLGHKPAVPYNPDEIRALRARGMSLRGIERRLGISRMTAQRIVSQDPGEKPV